jgi:hypothetical protein
MVVHLVTRTYGGKPAFAAFEQAKWMWDALRGKFAGALAAVLMPAHLHLIAEIVSAAAARLSLAHILGAFCRRFSRSEEDPLRWQPIPKVVPIAGPEHLRRQVRYVHLNPCRDKLVHDPLEWAWSTHRDAVGAVADPWVTVPRLARLLDDNERGFADRFHRYVSSDKSCEVQGTPAPQPPRSSACARFPLERIMTAAAAATRQPLEAARTSSPTRTAFVLLAQRQGWTDARVLARACAMSTRGIRDLRSKHDANLVAAATLCLGDDRLLSPWRGGSR